MFIIEGVEVGVSESSIEKLLVTATEGTTGVVIVMWGGKCARPTGVVIKVEDEEARDGDEERVLAVEEIIVLDEGTRGRRMGCSSWKGSARCSLWG